MHPYVVESFADAEAAELAPYVSNLDQPVFALTNLPEVVKGAMFSRYSRSPKSLRRLFLDEFAQDVQAGDVQFDDPENSRAARLYDRIFVEYGDDSVAQLGGAHVAVEQASNLLTKVLQWGRLAAYLEQSTRYVPYDDKPDGRYRYYRDPDIMRSPHGTAYEQVLDATFDAYAQSLPKVREWAEQVFPRDEQTSPAAYRRTITAKACDLLRGLLPAATLSNMGIFASGQSYEQLLLRLRRHDLAEARHVGALMYSELQPVIGSFLSRVDRPDRGGRWSAYLADTRQQTRALAAELVGGLSAETVDEVTLVGHWPDDPDTELVTGILYPHSHLPESQLRRMVEGMSNEDRERVVRAWAGERGNRRHKPGRALERIGYQFDVCGDYGAFRDLQRHRMLTIDWQPLSVAHGYETPPELSEAGVAGVWREALERQAELYESIAVDLPAQAQYVVGLAYRVRYSIQLNARAAMQMLELRTSPQGHPSYRRVCQAMHRLIRDQPGHTAVAELMSFVDHSTSDLERLESERRAEARRASRA